MEFRDELTAILLVEDDDVDAETIQRLMHRSTPRATLLRATTLGEALEHLETDPVDVVLLDLGLPDSQGLDTLDRLLGQTGRLPIVVLTGQHSDRLALDAVERGAQDYLEKDRLEEWLLTRVVRYAINRHRAEERARRKQALIQQHLTLSGTLFVALDLEGRVTMANPKACSTLGLGAEDLIGVDWIERFVSASDREDVQARLDALRTGTGDEQAIAERTTLTETGEPRTVLWTTASVRDSRGQVVGTMSSGLDITERKEAERRLRLLATSVAEANEAIVITDTQLDPPGPRILFVNTAFERMTGYTSEEALGKTPRILQGPETDRAMLNRLKAVLRRGEVFRGETMNYRKDGSTYLVHWSITPVGGEDGMITHYVSVQRDVTEAREAERQRARLAAIVESSDAAILSLELDGTITSWNDGATALYGFGADAMVGRSVEALIPEDQMAGYQWYAERVRGGESVQLVEMVHLHAEGFRIPVAVTVSPIRNPQGGVVGASGIARDVTERKAIEQALQASERRYRRIVETANEGIWQFDAEGVTTYVNAEMAGMLGYPVEEMIGMHLFETMDAESRARAEKLMDERKQGVRTQHTFTFLRKDGEPLEAIVGTAPLLDEDGTYQGALAMVTDITERKQAEEALRRSQERLDNAQRIAGLGHWERNLEEETLFWSDQTRRIFGWGMEERVTYEQFIETIHPDDREAVRRQQERALRGEAPIDVEYRLRRPDGIERIVYEQGEVRFDDDGQARVLAGTVLDITERKRTEQELVEAKREAERMNALKSAFLANMSHEIRTPLTSVLGYAELLQDLVQEESLIEEADAIAEFAEAIGRGGQRLQRTLTSVLDLSHIESDTLEVRPQSFDADALVAETIDFFRPQATERGLRIYPVLPERPVPVETDQSALTRILDNLISNAVKFTPEGHVTVGLVAAEDEIIVWVLDTGIGMSQAFMERLFEPFVQESAGIDRDFEGVGIGMTITRRLTELLGGTIAVSSKQDEGSLFTVTVPRRYAGG